MHVRVCIPEFMFACIYMLVPTYYHVYTMQEAAQSPVMSADCAAEEPGKAGVFVSVEQVENLRMLSKGMSFSLPGEDSESDSTEPDAATDWRPYVSSHTAHGSMPASFVSCSCVYIHLRTSARMCVCVCMCACVCIYTHAYIHIYIMTNCSK